MIALYIMGGAVITAMCISWWAERQPAFQEFDAEEKASWMYVSSGLIGFVAWLMATFIPPEWLNWLVIPFGLMLHIAVPTIGNQAIHLILKRKSPAIKPDNEQGPLS